MNIILLVLSGFLFIVSTSFRHFVMWSVGILFVLFVATKLDPDDSKQNDETTITKKIEEFTQKY